MYKDTILCFLTNIVSLKVKFNGYCIYDCKTDI